MVLFEAGVHTARPADSLENPADTAVGNFTFLRRSNRRRRGFGITVRAERNRIGARPHLGLAEIVPPRAIVRAGILRRLILALHCFIVRPWRYRLAAGAGGLLG